MKTEKVKFIATILGSLLIIFSTILIGIINLGYESEIRAKEYGLSNSEEELRNSERLTQYASFEFSISHIQKSIVDNSVYRFDESGKINEAWVAALCVILHKQADAAGYNFSEYTDGFIKLRDRAIEGEKEAYQSMLDKSYKLSEEAGYYRADLVQKNYDLKSKIDQLKSKETHLKYLSVICQIAGLFLLLFRELPNKVARVKPDKIAK